MVKEATQQVVVKKVYKHSRDRVWRAISRSEEIAGWFMQNNFELRRGAELTFQEEPSLDDCGEGYDGFIRGRLLEFEEGTSITWTFKTNLMNDDSVVTFSLADHVDGTELTIFHRNLDESVVQKEGTYADINRGWSVFSESLVTYLDEADGTAK